MKTKNILVILKKNNIERSLQKTLLFFFDLGISVHLVQILLQTCNETAP